MKIKSSLKLPRAAAGWLQVGLLGALSASSASAVAGTLPVLHTFNGNTGSNPLAPLIKSSDGNLYETAFGVNNDGVVFRISDEDENFDGTVFAVTY